MFIIGEIDPHDMTCVWPFWDYESGLRSEWAGYKVAVTQSIPARHDCRSATADCSPAFTQLKANFNTS